MESIHTLFNLLMHLDTSLAALANQYGVWIYGLLFLIIFSETGLVITPFLPGDSLLFAAGALSASIGLQIHLLFILLTLASVIGNLTNYFIGKYVGLNIFHSKTYLEKTRRFYQQYGGKTIILARFIPIIRTFAPFLAGMGYMAYRQFLLYNLIGAVLWVGSLLYVSYFFGNLPLVKNHFTVITFAIIFASLALPLLVSNSSHFAKIVQTSRQKT